MALHSAVEFDERNNTAAVTTRRGSASAGHRHILVGRNAGVPAAAFFVSAGSASRHCPLVGLFGSTALTISPVSFRTQFSLVDPPSHGCWRTVCKVPVACRQ
jgi:hypothetical protein